MTYHKQTCGQEDSPAKTSAWPVNKSESTEAEAVYFSTGCDWPLKYDPDSCCWRTSAPLLTGDSPQYLGRWPRTGMMRNGIVSMQPSLVPPIDANGFSFLPTPQASDGHFYTIKRPVIMRGNCYRITSNQGIDGNAKMSDIAWTVWDGPWNPQYAEAMMGFPQDHTAIASDA